MFVRANALDLLKERRNELGLSGTEVSRRMGLKTPQHYWNLENGKNRLTLEYAFLAAKALHEPIDFLCEKVKEKI